MSLPEDPTTVTNQADMQRLVDGRQAEGQRLDYKGELPVAWNDKAKHDLLSDVSAFANASGGHLIFGMEQDADGCAAKIVPQRFSPDTGSMQIESILRDGVEPRMPGIRVVPIPVEIDGRHGHVVHVHAPRSWVGPHRLKATRYFYVRDGRQSRPVDVPELRSLFLRTDSQVRQIRDFRIERLAKILAGEAPYRLISGPVLVLHLVPLQAAMGSVSVDPVQYLGPYKRIPVLASNSGAVASLVNLDGAAGTRNPLANGTNGYTLLFREGFVEATWVLGSNSPAQRGVLPGDAYEDYIAQFVTAVRKEFVVWGVDGQIIAMLSILDANDVALGVRREYAGDQIHKFDRKVLAIPDVSLAGEAEVRVELKPLFDLVWQSAGFEGSPH